MKSESPVEGTDGRLLVACLCAAWCTVCRDYRAVFDQVALEHADLCFLWIDIEDSAVLVDPVDVENFPTILIGGENSLRFFGAITPQREVLRRLIGAKRQSGAGHDPGNDEVRGLLSRLQGIAD